MLGHYGVQIMEYVSLLKAYHRNFCPTKKCPRIKFFRKCLSHGIKFFVLGQNFSENIVPPKKNCPIPHRTKIFRKIFILGQKFSDKFCPRTKYFGKFLSLDS